MKIYKHEDYFLDENTITTPGHDDARLVIGSIIFIWTVLLSYFFLLIGCVTIPVKAHSIIDKPYIGRE